MKFSKQIFVFMDGEEYSSESSFSVEEALFLTDVWTHCIRIHMAEAG